jgi:hypothetical protein
MTEDNLPKTARDILMEKAFSWVDEDIDALFEDGFCAKSARYSMNEMQGIIIDLLKKIKP